MELKKYEKDSYIVLLPGNDASFDGWRTIPFFYCYQLDRNSSLRNFTIKKDLESDQDGWDGRDLDGWDGRDLEYIPGTYYNIREATNQEMRQYQLLDEPYDVRELPEEEEEEDLTYLVEMINNLKINAK